MEEVARVVLALEQPQLAEEVLHFLDRSGRARVVGTASDGRQLQEAIRQLEPDAVVAEPSLTPPVGDRNGCALLTLGTTQSVATLRRAIHAGAAGFFLWPAEREELAAATARMRAPIDLEDDGRSSVIAVYGARGGTGATFVATHLCAALARLQRRSVLIDMDVVFAGASAAVGAPGAEDQRTIADLLPLGDEVAPRHLEDVLWRHSYGFHVLLAPRDEAAAVSIRGSNYRAAIAAARRMSDVVVLHVPRGLDDIARAGLELSDRVLVVLGLDVASFRDGKRAIAAVGVQDRCAFVVNRAGRSEISPRDVERVFGTPALAVIPSDRAVGAAQDRGRLLPLRGRTGRALTRLARRVMEAE